MRRFRCIMESTTPPPTDCIWLYNDEQFYFTNGKWVKLSEGGDSEGILELETKVDDLDKEVGQNKTDIAKLKSQSTIELEIGNTTEIKTRNLTKLKAIQSTDHLFFADIDYGYGPARWLPTDGGEAFITTSKGVIVEYTIAADGSITKGKENDLTNFNNDLFEIVAQLPEVKDAKQNKIYCVKDSTSTDDENKYTEFVILHDDTEGTYKWEIVGQFSATPDLSNYLKLSDSVNNNIVQTVETQLKLNNYLDAVSANFSSYIKCAAVSPYVNGLYLKVIDGGKPTQTFATNGSLMDAGSEEEFKFTLEDGSVVTKSIRVVSTTSTSTSN